MNREIKFRAWDETLKEMVYPQGCPSIHASDLYNSAELLKRYSIPLQFTGLKDKNGKEIYEGDVLQITVTDYDHPDYKAWSDNNYEGDGPTKTKVDYCTLEHFRFWMKNERFGYEGEELQSPDEWEIIGNIYENPDLIK